MNRTSSDNFAAALEAVFNLWMADFANLKHSSGMVGMIAHGEIERSPIARKTGPFYRHLVPLRTDAVILLAHSYRMYFKIALAHPSKTGGDASKWAWNQLQPAIVETLEWIRNWYILACDDANQYRQPIGTIDFQPGQSVSLPISTAVPSFPSLKSWRAPAWLFQISLAFVGVGPLKSEHVPARDSQESLGAGHTRLLLKGARRMFLWELAAAIDTVRDEETAAAGAIPAESVGVKGSGTKTHQLRGYEGLGQKVIDLTRYMDTLTEKQRMAFSLKFEYRLGLTEIALRMALNRKTAYGHIDAAQRKIDQAGSNEKNKARVRTTPE